MGTKPKNKYYLEVIGGQNTNQLYVVNAYEIVTGEGYYRFVDEFRVMVACYPIEHTIIKSIEVNE